MDFFFFKSFIYYLSYVLSYSSTVIWRSRQETNSTKFIHYVCLKLTVNSKRKRQQIVLLKTSSPNLNKRSSNKNEDAHWDMVTKHLFIFKYLNVPKWGVIYVYVYHLNLAEFDFFNQMATSSWLRIWYLICSWEIKI
jgi:hypothetical protein